MITEEIIKEAQAGNSQAFATIYDETVRTSYYVAKRILLDDDATEDVLQESYIAVYNHLSDFQTGNLQGWVDTIVANRAKNYLRRKNPILFSEMETEEKPVVEFEEEKIEFRPDEKVDYDETQRLVLEIVDNLSPEQRLSIMLFYFEDKSVKEIAEICECSENTVKSRLNYARKKIKEDVLELEKKGTKLYSAPIIPFIIWMLSKKAKVCQVPQGMSAKVLSGVNSVTNIAANSAGNVVVNIGSKTATDAIVGKAGMAIGVKIGIAAATVAAVVGLGIGIVMLSDNNDASKNDEKKSEYSENMSEDSSKGDTATEDVSKDEADNDETSDNSNVNGNIEILGGGNYIKEKDKNGKTIFFNGYGTINLEEEVIGDIYKGYYIYAEEAKYGLKHLDGRIIVKAGTYDEINWIDTYSGSDRSDETFHEILLVKGKDGYGVINAEGEIVIQLEYESIENVETSKLDDTSYYKIITNKTDASGNIVSVAYKDDGTKIFELTGEKIDKLNFKQDDFLYEKKDESGNVVALLSTKSGEVLFDYVKDGIKKVFDHPYSADITYTDGSKKYVAFNEDYTSYVFISDELGNDFSVLKTGEIYGFYKYFEEELDLYIDNQLVKSIEGVEEAWECEDKIYYIAGGYVNDNYIVGLYDNEGIILSNENCEWYYHEVFTERYIVIKSNNETTYQLYDLVNKQVVAKGIVNPESIDSSHEYFTLQLEDGRCVTVWKENVVVYHDSDLKMFTVCDDYMVLSKNENSIRVIADLNGNITYEYEEESHKIDYIQRFVLDVSGDTRAYYNFNGELVHEVEK